ARDDGGIYRVTQNTRLHALVQPVIDAVVKQLEILALSLPVPGLRVLPDPKLLLLLPLTKYTRRHRIPQPPRDKKPHLPLLPMRQAVASHFNLPAGLKKGGGAFLLPRHGAGTIQSPI